jgi:chemotaxis protein methyltransferase CheR
MKARAGQPIRIWSAACSTGQEPYSVAMLIEEEAARLPGLRADILGTDLSLGCLAKARAGLYSQFEAQRGLAVQRLVRCFDQLPDGWAVKPQLRAKVRWRQLNLLEEFRFLGTFDVVFCRNVLIYFDRATKAGILERIAERMSDEGRLLLGASESVLGLTQALQSAPGAPTLYMKVAGANAAKPAASDRRAG